MFRTELHALAATYEPGLVSVIIPCYNGAPFVQAAVDSALAQSHSPIEVIVVDDGSNDDSADILKSYGDRIRTCLRQQQGGGPVARNDGLALARGEWIQFLDADDMLTPKSVELRLAAMEPGAGAVFGIEERMDEAGDLLPTRPMHEQWPPGDLLTYLLQVNINTNLSLHRRRLLYESGGWNENMPVAQEKEFHLRLLLAGHRFVLTRQVVSIRRVHTAPGRITTLPWHVLDPDRYLTASDILLALTDGKRSSAFEEVLAAMLWQCGVQAAYHGAWRLALRHFRAVAAHCPVYQPRGRLLKHMTGLFGQSGTGMILAGFWRLNAKCGNRWTRFRSPWADPPPRS